jgi:cytochrome c oxidase subunit 2
VRRRVRFLIGLTAFFSLLIAGLILYYAVKFRRRAPDSVGARIEGGLVLEITWTVIPLAIVLVIFTWGASVFFAMARPPADTLNIYVVGKQWMWKFQHLNGAREINELHVPVGQPVKMIMTSEDVIHDLFFPAFRVKADVIRPSESGSRPPGPNLIPVLRQILGRGTGHDLMVVVPEPSGFRDTSSGRSGIVASAGGKLFRDLACNTCHRSDAQGRGPVLDGLFGKSVTLQSGETLTVDQAYIRESIVNPNEKLTAGFQPIMPAYQGQVNEEQLLELIEYVRALGTGASPLSLRPDAGGPRPGENTPSRGGNVPR